MLATALPPALPAPVTAPAANAAAGGGSGPESFARMLDAADARRLAQDPVSKAPASRPAHKGTAEPQGAVALRDEAEGGDARPTQAGDDADRAGTAATASEAAIELHLPTAAAAVTDAAALLAGLAVLPRPPAMDAATPAATHAAPRPAAVAASPAGLLMPSEATGDAGEPITTRAAVDALADTGTASRRTGSTGATASGSNAGQVQDNFSQRVHAAGSESGPADQAVASGTPRLHAAAAQTTETQPAGSDSLPSGAVLPSAAGALPAAPGNAAAVGQARLAASPGSPEFASQLGAQLTTFVRDGVQHAWLELHPLELGPVTVQISLDGTQARVNLAAEHAATRQALEQAMPALAGSLREAGLVLSGGGVFEQPRQPQPDRDAATAGGGDRGRGRDDRGEPARAMADSGPAPLASAPLRRRGVVDLVA